MPYPHDTNPPPNHRRDQTRAWLAMRPGAIDRFPGTDELADALLDLIDLFGPQAFKRALHRANNNHLTQPLTTDDDADGHKRRERANARSIADGGWVIYPEDY